MIRRVTSMRRNISSQNAELLTGATREISAEVGDPVRLHCFFHKTSDPDVVTVFRSLEELGTPGSKYFGVFSNLCGTQFLTKTWKVCTKVVSYLEQGQRLENSSLRLESPELYGRHR
ncbi:hypothetical protein FPV67DRAFT_221157 [Lyophyllum atratum]|nr:hypothetical protein FPV67DRAFT_221157 [Lyophyllum atratum]